MSSEKFRSTEVTDFLSWFQREYLKRRQKNSNYSVRAFANYLDIFSATVSHLLSGKRKPSAKFVTQLFTKLEATPEERYLILASVKKKATSDIAIEPANNDKYHSIAVDSFKIISDWWHFAILELVSTQDFQFDYLWISRQLNISVIECRQAIARLLRLDLLIEKNGTVVRSHGFVTNGEDDFITSTAHKQLQRHVLEKALEAIDTCPIEDKEITSMTMAIDESKLPQARKLITKFRRDMCQFLENGTQTRVYNLGIQLYPLSIKSKDPRR